MRSGEGERKREREREREGGREGDRAREREREGGREGGRDHHLAVTKALIRWTRNENCNMRVSQVCVCV